MPIFKDSHKSTYLPLFSTRMVNRFGFNESAHVMVKQKKLATDLSKGLGLVKSSFRSNPSSFFSWNCGSNLPTYMHVSSQLFVLTAPSFFFFFRSLATTDQTSQTCMGATLCSSVEQIDNSLTTGASSTRPIKPGPALPRSMS